MLLYFAGPLFSKAEKDFNIELTQAIERLGYEVFLPQRDGVERDKPEYKAVTAEDRRAMMFELDTSKVVASDIFLFILDGRVPDEGACVELGLAYGDKKFNNPDKSLVGLMTDSRAAFIGSHLNPMLSQAFDEVFTDTDTLVECLSLKLTHES